MMINRCELLSKTVFFLLIYCLRYHYCNISSPLFVSIHLDPLLWLINCRQATWLLLGADPLSVITPIMKPVHASKFVLSVHLFYFLDKFYKVFFHFNCTLGKVILQTYSAALLLDSPSLKNFLLWCLEKCANSCMPAKPDISTQMCSVGAG